MDLGDFLDGREGYTNCPTDADIKQALDNGLIVLDSNILLNFYEVTEEVRNEYIAVFTHLADRIFIPSRVAEEFLDSRAGTILRYQTAVAEAGNKLRKSKTETIKNIDNLGVLPETKERLKADIDGFFQKLIDSVPKIDYGVSLEEGEDQILELLTKTFAGRVGKPPNPTLLQKDIDEGQYRFQHSQPPGAGDKAKLVNGDYLLWAEVMRQATEHDQVLLVTNDRKKKADWFDQDWKRRPERPHPRLWNETKRKCGADLNIVDFPKFIELNSNLIEPDKAAEVSVSTQRNARTHDTLGRPWETDAFAGMNLVDTSAFDGLTAHLAGMNFVDTSAFDGLTAGLRGMNFLDTSAIEGPGSTDENEEE